MSFCGKTVILFGSGVIASGYARLITKQAKNVVLVSRGDSCQTLSDNLRKDESLSEECTLISMNADVSDFTQLKNIFDQTVEQCGRIDLVINGSGGIQAASVVSSLDDFINMKPEIPESMMSVNYLSKRYSLQLFAKYLNEAGHKGSVVNITSMSGLQPLSKVIDYSAAFGAVENLTKSAAHLYGKTSLGRVNNVAVGFTIGKQNRKLLVKEPGVYTPRAKEIIEGTSQTRFLNVKEIAQHVLYLADDELSECINGHTLCVDSGYNLVSLPGTAGY